LCGLEETPVQPLVWIEAWQKPVANEIRVNFSATRNDRDSFILVVSLYECVIVNADDFARRRGSSYDRRRTACRCPGSTPSSAAARFPASLIARVDIAKVIDDWAEKNIR
jgi:hypothetical protein